MDLLVVADISSHQYRDVLESYGRDLQIGFTDLQLLLTKILVASHCCLVEIKNLQPGEEPDILGQAAIGPFEPVGSFCLTQLRVPPR